MKRTTETQVKISDTTKMPCYSWSLEAVETCPGARDSNGDLVPVCSGCYAADGFYVFEGPKGVRRYNREDWKRKEWVDDMVAELREEEYFRWFDSGDVYHPELGRKIYAVMTNTPWCKHWLPTRSYKIERIRFWLEKMKKLPNVNVRYSADTVDGTFDPEFHGSAVVPNLNSFDERLCRAYTRDGHCGDCRNCWDKNIPIILYPAHGRNMIATTRKEINPELF